MIQIKTPAQIEIEQNPLIEKLIVTVNKLLLEGSRVITNAHVGVGHQDAIRHLLQKSGWHVTINVEGNPGHERTYLYVSSKKEIQNLTKAKNETKC